MADKKGDIEKKKDNNCCDLISGAGKCPNIEEGYGDMELTRYECKKCGEYYTLYEDEMK